MKKIITIIIAAVMCFAMTACGQKVESDPGNEIHIRILNEADSAYGLGLTYYFDDVAVHSTGMNNANGSKIGFDCVDFTLMREEVPEDADLDKFSLRFTVTEENGVELSVCTMYFPVQFGNTYNFKLINEDGCYAVWSEIDGETHSGLQLNSSEKDVETILITVTPCGV